MKRCFLKLATVWDGLVEVPRFHIVDRDSLQHLRSGDRQNIRSLTIRGHMKADDDIALNASSSCYEEDKQAPADDWEALFVPIRN